jgi:nucleoside-triphosphatase
MEPHAILLTGPPGVGKSTIIQTIVREMGAEAGGCYVRADAVNGERTHFEAVTLAGERALLAMKSAMRVFPNEATFGAFRVNLDALHDLVIPALLRAASSGQIVILDEIGPMQIVSPRFCEAVLGILHDPAVRVCGTIVERPWPFADDLKRLARVQLIPVTHANRDSLPAQVLAQLRGDPLEEKRRKAIRYAAEPDRFRLEGLHLRMRSEHGERDIRYDDGRWTCTCPFYQSHGTCSHIMAAQHLLGGMHVADT